MSALYEVSAERTAGPGICLHLRLRNHSGEPWRAGEFALGYQLFDPETYTLIFEGSRTHLAADVPPDGAAELDVDIGLPPETGSYRVFVSPFTEAGGWDYARGRRFVVVDAAVADGCVTGLRARVTTERAIRASVLLRSLGRGFTYPARSIWRNHSLIRSMVRRDILGRYRGSFGGLFWTVLNPLLLMLTYFFVFGIVLRTRFGNDPSRAGFVLYFLAGMLPWLAFSEAAGRAPFVILEYRNFVKKLVFPLETLPMNLVIAGLVTEAFALAVFVVGLLAARGPVPLTVAWLPALIVPQLLFTMGLCWFLAALGVYVRDLGQIIGFVLTLWFFLTPICYPVESLPPEAVPVLSKNPMFGLVRGYRAIFLEAQPPPFPMLWKLWLLSAVVFLVGYAWFYKLQKNFADVI